MSDTAGVKTGRPSKRRDDPCGPVADIATSNGMVAPTSAPSVSARPMGDEESAPGIHSIKLAALRSGLTAHVIRIWEKRYGAVHPGRTSSKRRLYSEADIERLSLLRELTQAGHTIGGIAHLTSPRLHELRERTPAGEAPAAAAKRPPADPAADLRQNLLAAIRAFAPEELEGGLNRGHLLFGTQGLLRRVLGPLLEEIGEAWRNGYMTAAQEHFAILQLRFFLANLARSQIAGPNSPCLLVATPSGQWHELGAMLTAAAASNLGWRVTYLGANLPAAEIAGAAIQMQARAVALSLIYPADDAQLAPEIERLRTLLPSQVPLLIGGRAAVGYAAVLGSQIATLVTDFDTLGTVLETCRAGPAR